MNAGLVASLQTTLLGRYVVLIELTTAQSGVFKVGI